MSFESCKNSKSTFYCQKSVFVATILLLHISTTILGLNEGSGELNSHIMSNEAKPFNLIEIFRLLQLAHVTFISTLPHSKINKY